MIPTVRAIKDLLLLKIIINPIAFRTECITKLFFHILILRLGWLIYYSLISNNFNYKASFAAYIRLIYLNLVVNRVTVI